MIILEIELYGVGIEDANECSMQIDVGWTLTIIRRACWFTSVKWMVELMNAEFRMWIAVLEVRRVHLDCGCNWLMDF